MTTTATGDRHTVPISSMPAGRHSARSGGNGVLLALLLVGQFMALLDATIVNVAMRTIGTDLHASGASLQLIVSGYTVSYAVLLITGARLGNIIGRRRMFLYGLLGFVAASLLCGLAPNTLTLIVMRFIQGAGAAAMVPQILSMINAQFTGPARSRALGAYSAVIAIGAVAGQVAGGILVDADIAGAGWRPIFLVNVPIGVVLAAAVTRIIPRDVPAGGRKLDLVGLAVVVPSVLLVVLPLVLGHEYGWPAWSFVLMALGVVGGGIFVRAERGIAARGGDPLLDVRVLRIPGIAPGLLTMFGAMAAYGGSIFCLSLHLQGGLGDSALRSGLTFAPGALVFGIASLTWRRLPARIHHTLSVTGLLIAAAAVAWLATLLHGGGQGGAGLYVALVLWGLGQGLAFGSMLAHSLVNVPPASAADASGLLTTTFQLGQAVGTAIFGSVFLSLAAHPDKYASAHAFATAWWAIAGVFAACAIGGSVLGRTVLRVRREAAAAAVAEAEPAAATATA